MTEIYTNEQATDEAVLLLTRKLRRLHPAAYADLMERIGEGAHDALILADNRADMLRHRDKKIGTTRRFTTIAEMSEIDSDEA